MKKFLTLLMAAVLLMTSTALASPTWAAENKPAPTTITSYSVAADTLHIKWKKADKVSGYEIEYADNRFFMDPNRYIVKKASILSCKITKNVSNLCYIRIRTYHKSKKRTEYSDWSLSSNCSVSKRATVYGIDKGNDKFEIRSASGESVGKYDTLQGGCTYKNTGWFVLYNRNVSKCKIARFDMKSLKIKKLSKELPLAHGNDATYNPDRNELVICHGPYRYKTLSIVDPDTLTIKRNVTLTLPKGTPGASSSTCSKFAGITSIAYNSVHKQYVVRLKSLGNAIIYDQSLKPVEYVKLSRKDNQLYQGMETLNDFILISQSPNKNGKYNIISVYDWSGKYLSKITLGNSAEIESVFVRNGDLYAGYYKSYYKTYYVDGFKIKVYKGKKNKIKTKLKYTKLMRENYLYKISNL